MAEKKPLMMTLYIIGIIIYFITAAVCYHMLLSVNPYYLFVLLPCLLLFVLLFLSSFIKLIAITISSVFGKNGNDEVNEKADNFMKNVNRITKYSLIGLFLTFLTSVMILDIILCINKEKYTVVAISIVVWILLHTLLFKNIIELVRSEKKPS
jgi:hypothetical protein